MGQTVQDAELSDFMGKARVSPRKAKQTDEGRKADDGRFVLLVRLSMGNHESALREYLGPTGKRSAVKVACCVWDGERL